MEMSDSIPKYVEHNRLPDFKATQYDFALISEKLTHIEKLLEEIMRKISGRGDTI